MSRTVKIKLWFQEFLQDLNSKPEMQRIVLFSVPLVCKTIGSPGKASIIRTLIEVQRENLHSAIQPTRVSQIYEHSNKLHRCNHCFVIFQVSSRLLRLRKYPKKDL